ncbi:MAG: fructosamine kinase family protein [Gammaproteobacteria bacterium]|nr:fructosamine kinase family protein [Gammaproteobacteria bacterium]
MILWEHIAQAISEATGKDFQLAKQQALGGGCINESNRISDGERSFFVKTNSSSHGDMFEAEAESLQELADAGAIKVPQPVCHGIYQKQCFLVLEYLDMGGSADMVQFGHQFADLHRRINQRFGWHRNNTIGSTPQINEPMDDWVDFWRQNRLGYQLQLAASNGYGGKLQKLGERLLADLPILFESYQPQPSMLHGDLWGGNASALADGSPVIYDPAFYYGDREADLAMTHLFGGFNSNFYSAYNDTWPLDDGYPVRKVFYNLYHIINHLNIFGGGYHGQAIAMTEQVLAEI